MENKDYSISWKYIIEVMEQKFDLSPTSDEKMPMGHILRCLDIIWDDYYDTITRGLEP